MKVPSLMLLAVLVVALAIALHSLAPFTKKRGDDAAAAVERLLQNSRIEEAQAMLHATIENGADDVATHTNLGRCYFALGNVPEAMASFELASRRDAAGSSYHGAYSRANLGRLARHVAAEHAATGGIDAALAVLERGLAVAPTDGVPDDATLNQWAVTLQQAAAPSHQEGKTRDDGKPSHTRKTKSAAAEMDPIGPHRLPSTAHIINLPSRPARRASAEAVALALGLRAEVLPAVTPDQLTSQQLAHVAETPTATRPQGYGRGEASCGASHAREWQRAATGDAPAVLILEDDVAWHPRTTRALLDETMRRLPASFTLLYLGHCFAHLDTPAINASMDRETPLVRGAAMCTHAYVLSREGAKRLVRDAATPALRDAVDREMARLCLQYADCYVAYPRWRRAAGSGLFGHGLLLQNLSLSGQRSDVKPSTSRIASSASADLDTIDGDHPSGELLWMPQTVRVATDRNGEWGARVLAQLLALHGVRLEWSSNPHGAAKSRAPPAQIMLVSHGAPSLRAAASSLWSPLGVPRRPHVYFSGEYVDHRLDERHSFFMSLTATTLQAGKPFHTYVPYFASSPYYRLSPRLHDHGTDGRPYALAYAASAAKRWVRHREDFFDAAVAAFDGDVVHALGGAYGSYPDRHYPIGGHWEDGSLVAALSRYRFHMAFENHDIPGYVTEKITIAFAAGCVPVYWGTRDVFRFFNREAFVYANDFTTFAALAEHLAAISDVQWRRMRNAPPYAHVFPVIRNETYADVAKEIISMAVL